jgi:hypothetical protein
VFVVRSLRPADLLPTIEDHLSKDVGKQRDALLFPAHNGGHLAPATLNRHSYRARAKANRPDLRFHNLRHSGAVLAAATGATLAELMARLGHSTPAAAMRVTDRAARQMIAEETDSTWPAGVKSRHGKRPPRRGVSGDESFSGTRHRPGNREAQRKSCIRHQRGRRGNLALVRTMTDNGGPDG